MGKKYDNIDSDSSSDDITPRHNSSNEKSYNNYGVRKRSRTDYYEKHKTIARDNYRSRLSKYNNDAGGVATTDRSPKEYEYNNFPYKKARRNSSNVIGAGGSGGANLNYFYSDVSRSSLNDVVSRMSTFKEFVLTLDDSIHPEDAVEAYFQYIKTFSNRQLDPFFKNYNECDWLMLKHHPLWRNYEHNFMKKCYQIRLYIFCELLDKGYMNDIVLDSSVGGICKKLHKFLIFLNILLECGGFDEIESCKNILNEKEITTNNTNINGLEFDDGDGDDDPKMISIKNSTNKLLNSYSSTNDELYIDGRHRTVSFNIKAIPIDTSREEIYKAFNNIDGFLRAYVSEPSLGKRDFRRAFITFKNNVNINDVAESVNNVKLRDNVTLLIRQSNELTRRVKFQELRPGCYPTLATLMFDVKMVCDLITSLDTKYTIFDKIDSIVATDEVVNDASNNESVTDNESINDNVQEHIQSYYTELLSNQDEELFQKITLPPKNPILQLLRDVCDKYNGDLSSTDVDELQIKKALDTGILYLRVIYSIDYYALMEYPYEHLRNIRCSTITIRSTLPSERQIVLFDEQMLKITEEQAVELYSSDVLNKFKPIIDDCKNTDNNDDIAGELKTCDKEIEDFIEQNTQKITDQKYLCPLSMKKFKSPEYVRKHIFSKHADKIEKVKLDVEYFNNFVKSRYKNLPFGVNTLRKRNQMISNAGLNSYHHNRKNSTYVQQPNDVEILNKDSSTQTNDVAHNSKNPKTYGRYRDFDIRSSMFDL